MDAIIKKAIQYIRDNKTWSDAEEEVAYEIMNRTRCSLEHASDKIYCGIQDLMEEFGEEQGYPEGWWYYDTDEYEIFLAL